MEIKIWDFTLTPTPSAIGHFDLYEEVQREKVDKETRKGTGEVYQGQSALGYGMKLESCINKIIHKRLNDKVGITTLKNFIEDYRKQKEEIKQLLSNI